MTCKSMEKEIELREDLICEAGNADNNYKQKNYNSPTPNSPLPCPICPPPTPSPPLKKKKNQHPPQQKTKPQTSTCLNSLCGTSLHFGIVTGHSQVANARNGVYVNVNPQKKILRYTFVSYDRMKLPPTDAAELFPFYLFLPSV